MECVLIYVFKIILSLILVVLHSGRTEVFGNLHESGVGIIDFKTEIQAYINTC